MSSGLPRLAGPDRPDSNLMVYADGRNPSTEGTDVTRILAATTSPNICTDDPAAPLITALRAVHANGCRWLHLTVNPYPDIPDP